MAIYPGQDAWNADEYCFEVCEAWICQHGTANFEAERRWLKSVIDLYLLHNESDRNRVQLERVWAGGMPRRDWVSGQFVDGELNPNAGQFYPNRLGWNEPDWGERLDWEQLFLQVQYYRGPFYRGYLCVGNGVWAEDVYYIRRLYHFYIRGTGRVSDRFSFLLNIWPTNFNSVTSLARGR